MNPIVILAGYAFLGGAIKYVDMAYDDNIFRKRPAFLVALLSGALGGYMMVADVNTAVIFFSILVGLAIAHKIDNIAFLSATGIAAGISMAGYTLAPAQGFPAALAASAAVLVLTSIADEKGNDYEDRHYLGRRLKTFLHFRPAMKFGMLGIAALGFLPWVYFAAFLLFDVSYSIVESGLITRAINQMQLFKEGGLPYYS